MEEEQNRCAKNDKRLADVLMKDATRCMNGEADGAVDLNEDTSIDTEKFVKVIGKSSRYLLFRKMMKKLSLYCRPLKYRMKDKSVLYVDLLRPGPPPSSRGAYNAGTNFVCGQTL